MEFKNEIILPLGDWSEDGHGESVEKTVLSNKTRSELQKAYSDSVCITGLNLADECLQEYEDNVLTKEVVTLLTKHNVDFQKVLLGAVNEYTKLMLDGSTALYDADSVATLFMEFLKISLPDLEYEVLTKANYEKYLFGYWDKNLNIAFGYGCFGE